jgi:ABC-type dipeptide/oligopeptide/nickel transport system permease component
MAPYIVQRLLAAILVLLGVSVFVFSILHLIPGDVAALLAARSFAGVSPEYTARIRHQLGLDHPLWIQYWDFLRKALVGDLGRSFYTNHPVAKSIIEQFPATLQLTAAALAIGVGLGLALGVVSAIQQNTVIDNLAMVFSLGGLSIPIFWSGLMLIYLFSVQLNWFPITSEHGWKTLVLPATVLGYDAAAFVTRMVRTSVLEILRQDFVRTARAKGLGQPRVIFRHVLKPAMIPTITLVGLLTGRLLGGAVVVETVFARQGVGRLALDAIQYKDYFLVQGIVLLAAVIYVALNLLVDVSYTWLDPRIRYQ